jgi:hypothetical protein
MNTKETPSLSEVSMVVSPGDRAGAWAAKVKSCASYNVYNVVGVEIGTAGTVPVEVGGEMQAVNLSEDFLQQGELAEGTYVVIHRTGDKNVFCAKL